MNRLGGATSPYLLQHASNPVDWWPWGEDALAEARRRDVPVLISVGYSSCHWCHVMAHESFEDAATASVMNEHFVNIKVDREERPDLDAIYMDAVQAMTGQGGWPMTVFLTPEGRPFFAGTYFPAEDRHGLPGFRKVLLAVAEAWRERRDDARRQGDALVEHIGRAAGVLAPAATALDEDLLRQAFEALRRGFDEDWGGFGAAPKFPQPMTLEFLLRCHLRGYQGALAMVTRTLDRMAGGGIFDQLGGGFHRYSTDRRWLVPHFEKMLYDNAQLLRVYTRAWQVTRSDRYRQVAAATAAYLLRELRHPEGGFYSSQDADSEGVEGKFFVWSHDELVATGGELAARWFGATPGGNWEGTNVLWTPRAAEEVAAEAGVPVAELERALGEARERLLAARERRMRPGTDDKVLTAWNGLAIAALAEAGRALGDDRLVNAAVEAAGFVLDRLRDGGGRLLRSWRAGRSGGPGYLDDYACLADACLALYETTFEPRWLEMARSLADDLVRLFADPEDGGFYQTGSDAERLVIRPRDLFDNAVPSGSSVAVDVLLRLARVRGDGDAEGRALEALRLVQALLPRAPGAFGHALCAADFALGPVREVAIVGEPGAPDTRALLDQVRDRFRPRQVLALGPDGDGTPEPPLLAGRGRVDGRATAYVCDRFACQLPVTEPEALAAQLGDTV